jgi:urease accessory protein
MMLRSLFAAAMLLAAGPALSHPPPLGLTGFSGGLLHPLFVPAHVLAITALGVLCGQQAPRWGVATPLGFIAALVVGLIALTQAVVPQHTAEAVLLFAIAAGSLVALARRLPEALGSALAAAIGIAVALDSPPAVISIREANLILIGTGLSAAAMLLLVWFCATRLTRPWQRIGLRVLGSWIAASAILVLALQLSQ